ncbi:MAG: ATP-binding protein, partial [Catonella sp.]
MIIREEYLHKLKVLKDKNIIKIVTGTRRCGKSTLLLQFRDWLIGHGVRKSQINLINFEDLEYEDLTDYKSLHKYIKERLKKNVKTYIFLDEIQNVDKFPKVLDSIQLNSDVDLYVTGSNAYML